MVETDMSTAAAAGGNTTPTGASTPAANGMAMMLYPLPTDRNRAPAPLNPPLCDVKAYRPGARIVIDRRT